MIPTSRPPRSPRRRFLGVSLLCVGLFSFMNMTHYFSYQSSVNDRQVSGVGPHHTLPQELIDFVNQGGFEDSENQIIKHTSEESGARSHLVEEDKATISTKHSNQVTTQVEYSDLVGQITTKIDVMKETIEKTDAKLESKVEYNKHTNRDKKATSQRHEGFPPLDRLVRKDDKGERITGPVDWLLDFAILGHAKCATTYLMNWLRQHESVRMHDREICDLNNRQPATLVQRLYTDLPVGEDYLRGYKCPGHFSREPLRYFRQYFPKTKLIVGLRHPVRWFESYYNFRIRHPRGGTMPPPQALLGKCVHESQGVCTDRANFHRNLAMLAKTNHSEIAQQKLLVDLPTKYRMGLSEIPNPVFLYDVGQLYDRNTQRKAKFQSDLEEFVGLDTPLPSNYTEPSSSKSDDKFTKLDICHSDFDEIRQELVVVGGRAATWITKYFIHSESVFVSSPDYFEEILKTWHYDPCPIAARNQ